MMPGPAKAIAGGPAPFNDRTDKLGGQKYVRTPMTGLHTHGRRHHHQMPGLLVGLDLYLSPGIPLGIDHRLDLFADLDHRARAFNR